MVVRCYVIEPIMMATKFLQLPCTASTGTQHKLLADLESFVRAERPCSFLRTNSPALFWQFVRQGKPYPCYSGDRRCPRLLLTAEEAGKERYVAT